MKEKLKSIINHKVIITNRAYYIALFAIPIIGMIIKNTLLQAYILGDNLYSPAFGKAISASFKYWIIYSAIVMLILSVALLFKRDKHRVIYVFAWNFFFTVLVSCDLIYSRSFFTMPSAADVYIFKNFSGFDGGEVSSLLCGWDILMFLDIIILGIFIFVFRRRSVDTEIRLKSLKRSGIIAVLVSIAILLAIPLQAKAFKVNLDIYREMFETSDNNKSSRYFSSLGFHIKDIYELLRSTFTNELSDSDEKMVDTYYEWKNEDLPDNEYAGMLKNQNILFLQIESLESFVIGREINGEEITPNINKLLQTGIIFNNVFEQVQGGNSSDADLMYTTSRLPVSKGSTFFRYSEVSLVSLPRYLVENDYNMLYSQAIRGSFWNYKEAWKNMIGVDAFVGAEKFDMDYEKIGFTINDVDFIKQAYPYIKELEAPYYAHIVLNSSHMPFEVKDELKQLSLPEELDDTYLGGYLQLVKYVDSCIGSLLQSMEEDGLLDNTTIVIIGDHTGVHKYYEYSLEQWYDEYPWVNTNGNYTVPLIISSNKIKEPLVSDVLAGQIDVMPTLAYLVGMPKEDYENAAMGRNLLNTNRSYAIFRDGTIYGDLTDEEKEIVGTSYKISEKLFEVGR